jgi:hypothetical protein
MLACVHMDEMNGEPALAFRAYKSDCSMNWKTDPTVNMDARSLRKYVPYLGPAHGFAGNMIRSCAAGTG